MPNGFSFEAEEILRVDIGGVPALEALVPPIVDIAIGLLDVLFDQALCGPHPLFLWRPEPLLERRELVLDESELLPHRVEAGLHHVELPQLSCVRLCSRVISKPRAPALR